MTNSTILISDANVVIEDCKVIGHVAITSEEAELNAEAWQILERLAIYHIGPMAPALEAMLDGVRALIDKREAIK